MYLVMECCDGGDLAKYIAKHKKLDEPMVRHIAQQIGMSVCAQVLLAPGVPWELLTRGGGNGPPAALSTLFSAAPLASIARAEAQRCFPSPPCSFV